jgi:DNA-binding transcriptional regulator YiaG
MSVEVVDISVDSPPVTGIGKKVGADLLAALLPMGTSADAPVSFRLTVQQALEPTVFLVSGLVEETSTDVIAEPMPAYAIFVGHSTGAGALIARTHPRGQRQLSWAHPHDARSTTERVRDLWEHSGLTWDQLARLFGVSRRAVHAWATGARPNAYHHELLTKLTELVATIDTGDPRRNRERLLAPRPGRLSLFDEFRAQHITRPPDITGRLAPAQLLGALHDREPGDDTG